MAEGSKLTRLAGFILLIIGVLGTWGGLSVMFEFYNPLGDFTVGLFNITNLFFSDLAAIIFWFIIILLGFALLTPKGKGYFYVLKRR